MDKRLQAVGRQCGVNGMATSSKQDTEKLKGHRTIVTCQMTNRVTSRQRTRKGQERVERSGERRAARMVPSSERALSSQEDIKKTGGVGWC